MSTRAGKDGIRFVREGDGPPLLLIPGTGSRKEIWGAIAGRLGPLFDSVAIDLPGCGESPPLDGEPTVADFTSAIESLIDELRLERPHVVGNSFGGWLALELAKRDRVRSATLLSPTGLWREEMPIWPRVLFRVSQFSGRALRPLVPPLAQTVWGRTTFTIQAFGRPWAISPDDITGDVLNLIHSPGVEALYRAARHSSFGDGRDIAVPISVAFGTRDFSLPRRAHRDTTRLPGCLRSFVLHGCGHVPMYDDPEAIIRIISETAARTVFPGSGRAGTMSGWAAAR